MTQQMCDDIIVNGEKKEEKHYCRQYDDKIDSEIVKDKKKCENYLKKIGCRKAKWSK